MKSKKLFSLIAVSMLLGSTSFAAEHQWEIWSGSLADFTLQSTGVTGADTLKNVNFLNGMNGFPGIGYIISDYNLEIKLSPTFSSTSNYLGTGSSGTNLTVLAGLNFSFLGNGFDDSFFIEALAGINSAKVLGTTNTNFAWGAGIGKRFKIINQLTWAPEFMVKGISQSSPNSMAMSYIFSPLQITLLL